MSDPFRVQLDRANAAAQGSRPAAAPRPANGPSFADTLANAQQVRFSNHAQNRLEKRDIQLSDDNLSRLSDAIDKAEKRGGKSSLVMVDDLTFIVNVRERLVVTALDQGHRGEGVFTQIDSVVFAEPAKSTINKQG